MGKKQTEPEEEIVYKFIRDYTRRHGNPPTLREIRDGCFMSVGNVYRRLDILEARGRIRRNKGKSRGVILSDDKE
jgi:SOS-response transcriptional repressor LexA